MSSSLEAHRSAASNTLTPAPASRAIESPGARIPAVSIIVPCFDAAPTLTAALQSVRRQTFRDWEAVIVDDGSSDASAQIGESWARRDGRIRVLRQQSAGVSAARNRGIAAARGEWLLFLDADDLLHPKALARLTTAARVNRQAGVVVGRSCRIDASGKAWRSPRWDLSDPFAVLAYECGIVIHSALVRRDLVQEVGCFDEQLRSSEDWDLWQRIARSGARFVQLGQVVAFYRSQPGSLSKDIRQLTADTLTVMEKGARPDPRVLAPVTAHALGADPAPLAYHRLTFVLWSAARDVARGGDGVSLFDFLPEPPDLDLDPEHAGEMLAAGMADYLAVQPQRLASRWFEYAPKLKAVLARAFPGEPRARVRNLTLLAIKHRLGVRFDGSDAEVIGEAALDLRAGLAALCAGPGEAAAVQLWRDRPIGVVACTLQTPQKPTALAGSFAEQLTSEPTSVALTAAKPWFSGAFWPVFIKSLFDPRGLGLVNLLRGRIRLPSDFAKQRLRFALLSGLKAAVRAQLAGAAASSGELRWFPSIEKASSAGALAHPQDLQSAAAWDRFYERDDPWGYASSYEQRKYDQTLELIPPDAGRVLELACAQGHFTAQLARKVGEVVATDISPEALRSAARRCEGAPNVTFQELNLAKDRFPQGFDAIVCSEVLYYLSPRDLVRTVLKIAEALKPGGVVVTANANQIVDEPESTGFDWGHGYGGKTVGECFAATPGLSLEREIRTPLYRVQAFRKTRNPAGPPRVESRPLGVDLEPRVLRDVAWGGAVRSRVEALRQERTTRLPILMYHRVSATVPKSLRRYSVCPAMFEQQVALLRRHGYWSPPAAAWGAALRRNRPLNGRPVLLTFDDGYADFAEHAWPVLRRYGFSAIVFLVAGKVGAAADWDRSRGRRPAPLMDWETLRELSAQGVEIGSHGENHRRFTRLTLEEVHLEAQTSSDAIADQLGTRPRALAYPYGARDRLAQQVVAECGYQLALSCRPGTSTLSDDPLNLPRLEITGCDDLTAFARKIGVRAPDD